MTRLESRRLAPLALFLLFSACAHQSASSSAPRPVEPGSSIQLVESAPVETTLDHPDVPNAAEVWVEMINSAKHSLDVAQFYASDEGNSRLSAVIAAIHKAAARGVRVRFLVDASFSTKYPETLVKVASRENIELRRLDVQKRMGGIHHAKYLVVDRSEAYLGSQNFDWRSLEHIQELGVRIRSKQLAGELLDVFNTDWEMAAGAPDDYRPRQRAEGGAVALASGEKVTFVASPKGWLPDEGAWDLPRLVALIDGAREEVGVQLLTYGTRSFDGSRFFTLDEALRRAAARGVKVRLLVSDWSNKPRSWPRFSISALARTPGIEVRVITIPPWSGGDIQFARVCHSKYMVVDGQHAWVGTSNWDGDYFLKSRNVGVVVDDAGFAGQVSRLLDDAWESRYSQPLEPMRPDEKPEQRRSEPAPKPSEDPQD